MRSYFDDLSDLDIEKIHGFELADRYSIYNKEYNISLVRHNNIWYNVHEEEENDYLENDGYIYLLAGTWYSKFNLDTFLDDVANGNTNPDDFCYEEYKI